MADLSEQCDTVDELYSCFQGNIEKRILCELWFPTSLNYKHTIYSNI